MARIHRTLQIRMRFRMVTARRNRPLATMLGLGLTSTSIQCSLSCLVLQLLYGLFCLMQEAEHSSDSAASGSDSEEDEEAKAARQGKRPKAARSTAQADALRQASRQAKAEIKRKKGKKRLREDAMAADVDDGLETELTGGTKVFVSDGPLAMADRDSERLLRGSQAQPRELPLCCCIAPLLLRCPSAAAFPCCVSHHSHVHHLVPAVKSVNQSILCPWGQHGANRQ